MTYRTSQRKPAPEREGWFSRWRRESKANRERKDLEDALRKAVLRIATRYNCVICSRTDCPIHGVSSAMELGRCNHSDYMDIRHPRTCHYCQQIVLPRPPHSLEAISAWGTLRKEDVINFYYWNMVNEQVLTDEELVQLKNMADRLFYRFGS